MPNRLKIEGLDELKAALRKLPAELAAEGGGIVKDSAEGALPEIRNGYGRHRRSGSLQDKVTVSHRASRLSATSVVKSGDKDALVFEVGSQARHTRIGANRGSMPPGNVFFPAVKRWKRLMYTRLKAMLREHGLAVTDDGG
jgi:hypothetical protein